MGRSEFEELVADTETGNDNATAPRRIGPVSASLLLLACAAAAYLWPRGARTGTMTTQDKASYIEKLRIAGPGGKACSGAGKDCAATKCCNVTGFQCFRTEKKGPVCLDAIKVGESAAPYATGKMAPKKGDTQTGDLVLWDSSLPPPPTSLLCFSVYAKVTGSTKKSYDLELLQTAYSLATGIFACDISLVFSDVPVVIGDDVTSIVIDMPHLAKRKSTGTWINGPSFQNAWAAIKADGRWSSVDWIVKQDPDAVFLPHRLKLMLSGQEVTEKGIYFTNCEHVWFGFFGSLEVMSRNAVATYLWNLEACKADPKINNITYGEDLFAQKCMNAHGVDNVENFYLTTDGACDAIGKKVKTKAAKKPKVTPDCTMGTPAFHPLKTVQKYLACWHTAQSHPR